MMHVLKIMAVFVSVMVVLCSRTESPTLSSEASGARIARHLRFAASRPAGSSEASAALDMGEDQPPKRGAGDALHAVTRCKRIRSVDSRRARVGPLDEAAVS